MSLPPPENQPQNKTAQVGNGVLNVLTAVLDKKTFTMAITVIYDTVVVDPVRKISSAAPFTLQIDVPPPLPTPLLPPPSPHATPPLPPSLPSESLPPILPSPSPSDLVAYKEDDLLLQ